VSGRSIHNKKIKIKIKIRRKYPLIVLHANLKLLIKFHLFFKIIITISFSFVAYTLAYQMLQVYWLKKGIYTLVLSLFLLCRYLLNGVVLTLNSNQN
jgi:hypothetical protein